MGPINNTNNVRLDQTVGKPQFGEQQRNEAGSEVSVKELFKNHPGIFGQKQGNAASHEGRASRSLVASDEGSASQTKINYFSSDNLSETQGKAIVSTTRPTLLN